MSAIRDAVQAQQTPEVKTFCNLVAEYIRTNGKALIKDTYICFYLAYNDMPKKDIFRLTSNVDICYFSTPLSIDAMIKILEKEGAQIINVKGTCCEIRFEI